MERISVDIERQDVVDALRDEASAHGRSIEAEVAALVERTYAGPVAAHADGDRPKRKSIGQMLYEASRPGIELDIPPRSPARISDRA